MAGIETPTGRLALLLGLFAAAMVLRGVVVSVRDIMISGFQLEFVDRALAMDAGHLRATS